MNQEGQTPAWDQRLRVMRSSSEESTQQEGVCRRSIYVTGREKPRGKEQPIFIRRHKNSYETRSLGSETKWQR